jgi:CRISPR-associated RAMP protein (TIGR02581 family)
MLKKMINHADIDLTIIPLDPMLIKSGQATVSGVDMAFVRTYARGRTPEPFIPGSSLKGVIRSYAEKICRSLRDAPVPVCLPYLDVGTKTVGEKNQASCGLRLTQYAKTFHKKNIPTPDIYRISCPACRLFGSHYFIGRLETSDGYLSDSFKESGNAVFETRDGVAIDRLTGGPVNGAKYDLEVLTKGEFHTRITVRNFERWQLGLLGLVLRDMAEGLIRIGMGKSRGLGRFRADINHFSVSFFGRPRSALHGIAADCRPQEQTEYGLFPEFEDAPSLPEPVQEGLSFRYDLTSNWQSALEPAVQDLSAYIDQVAWPRDIESYTERRSK